MEKVYGNPRDRAMQRRILHRSFKYRAAIGLLAALIGVTALGLPMRQARADDLMLDDKPFTISHGWGWAFLGLSLVSYAIAANDYTETENNVTKAKKAYKAYQADTVAQNALNDRALTTTYSDRAQAYESTTNAALLLGTIFAATAIAVFRFTPDADSDSPILLSQNSVILRLRF
jgi:hypothetical protein